MQHLSFIWVDHEPVSGVDGVSWVDVIPDNQGRQWNIEPVGYDGEVIPLFYDVNPFLASC